METAGEGSDAPAAPEELLRDVPAGVRESSGDDVELRHAAQPGFFATQISSTGHLRAHSAEKVS